MRRSRRARNAHEPLAARRPAGRLTRWRGLVGVSLLSALAILCTQGPSSEAQAQAPAKVPAKAPAVKGKAAEPLRNVPGAGSKLTAPALAQIIDREIQRRLAEDSVKPSPVADDAEFLRRIYLDLVGVIPPADKVVAFLDSKVADKRARVVEELLADSRYGRSLAENWTNVMVPRESNNRRLQSQPLHDWMAKSLNDNKPWDKLVYELVTASGDQDKNGAVTYFIGNPTVDKITDSVTRLFLGVRLECAQCHNHPFTGWKQTEYWGMAQFFMKVRLTANPQQAAKKGISPGIIEDGRKGKKKGLPESAKIVPAKFFQAQQPKLNPAAPYRPVLAKWLCSSSNPFFAQAMVNRTWAHFFGRGIVNPVDDMHEGNPASHPELLAALTEQFKTNGFDVKYLVRAIVNSQTYQRTSRPHAGNEEDPTLFSHMAVRVMSPEQLYDSLTSVVGKLDRRFEGMRKKGAGGKKGPTGPRDQFVSFFRIDEGADPLEYQAGIPQALRLMNSGLLNNTTAVVNSAMGKGGNDLRRVVEQLYLMTLSRRPTPEELQRRVQYVAGQPIARNAYSDLVWALLNCSEFAMNH